MFSRQVPFISTAQRVLCTRLLSGASPQLKTHHDRRLVRHTAQQLYDVVSDVNNYHQFVPWCKQSKITKRKAIFPYLNKFSRSSPVYHSFAQDNEFEADLSVGFGVFVEKYTSRVVLDPPHSVIAHSLTTNLLQTLKFEWKFTPASDPTSTWVQFKIEYAFKSSVYNHASDVFFADIVANMIKAFENRCQLVHSKKK